jgi:alkylated DNA repair dioxygenase AlkB
VVVFQPSLLDSGAAVSVAPDWAGSFGPRQVLGHGAWVEVARRCVVGSDWLFELLHRSVQWSTERRRMYDRVVDVPRLSAFYDGDEHLPHPFLAVMREALSDHYGTELGEPFHSVGLCLYRDGSDSVAWHGDTLGRGRTEDTMVAIVSLGTPRSLLLRPRGGGPSQAFELAPGDLLVMGGSCQRTWEHSIPKRSQAGPRISLQFRPHGVR